MMDNQNRLAEYVQTESDAAFRELVTHYVDLVYSTALRLVGGDAHRAQDVTQTVFVNLARVARTLPKDVKLGGWLHRDTCFAASTLMRGERRRQSRERLAAEMNALQINSEADYSLVGPVLDEAINELEEADRTAVLLRFFEQHDFRSVGQALGSNEDAARMRVTRALEKLEGFLKRRGITTTTASLGVVLSANAVQAAPAGLALTISTAAVLTGTTLTTTATVTATKAITMTTLQKTIVTATIAALAGFGIYETQQAGLLRSQVESLQQQTPLLEHVQKLTRDYNDAIGLLASLRDDNERLNHNNSDLLRLRAEVARLSGDTRELAQLKAATATAPTSDLAMEATLKSWSARASQLKQRLEQMPDKTIPELQLLTEKNWLDAVKNTEQLETDADYRQALGNLRSIAKGEFAELVRSALRDYATANDGQLPGNLAQLKSYFKESVDDAILQRYVLLQTGKLADVPKTQFLFAENAPPVDKEYDLFFQFKMQGVRSTMAADKR